MGWQAGWERISLGGGGNSRLEEGGRGVREKKGSASRRELPDDAIGEDGAGPADFVPAALPTRGRERIKQATSNQKHSSVSQLLTGSLAMAMPGRLADSQPGATASEVDGGASWTADWTADEAVACRTNGCGLWFWLGHGLRWRGQSYTVAQGSRS